MADDLVTLATYRLAGKAEVARWVLEQEGIRAFVADANLVTNDWFLGNAIGYIKLQVASSQAEAAMAILRAKPRLLDEAAPAETEDEGPAACLSCGKPMPDDVDRCASCGWSYGSEEPEENE
jgi:hypothetical protein